VKSYYIFGSFIHKVTTAFLRIQSVPGLEDDIDVDKKDPPPPPPRPSEQADDENKDLPGRSLKQRLPAAERERDDSSHRLTGTRKHPCTGRQDPTRPACGHLSQRNQRWGNRDQARKTPLRLSRSALLSLESATKDESTEVSPPPRTRSRRYHPHPYKKRERGLSL
jgi:hypothetical protein